MSAKYSCQIVADLLARHGVKYVVASPGSRNAPLIRAVDEHEELEVLTVVDERSAAFRALGMAQVSNAPVALICTSGTALLNYAPAVSEAYYQRMPLIVVSADRPAQWIDQDDSQTIRQPGALGNFVKYSCNIPDFSDPEGEMAWYAARCCNDAMLAALSDSRGPVHVNVQLGEPLNTDYPQLRNIPYISEVASLPALSFDAVKTLAEELAGRKVMIVAGFMQPSHTMSKALGRLAGYDNVVVLTESMANIHARGLFPCVDRILLQVDKSDEAYRPDVVITVGGALVSRNLKHYLRSCNRLEHWSVGLNDTSADVFRHLTKRIKADAGRFLSMLAGALRREKSNSDYSAAWQRLRAADEARHELKLQESPWSSLQAFAEIWPSIPAGTDVQLSNGTCVRYAQLFENPGIHSCHCNRGVSGIDGCTSTAAGASYLYKGDTLLITGDMSFSYDLNGLSAPLSPRLKVIVIKNGGGGIFRFIKATRDFPQRERYLCANLEINACGAGELFHFKSLMASSFAELKEVLPWLYAHEGPALLEVVVPADEDARAIINYFEN